MARGPKCFRCLMLMLSGPVELLFLLVLMASKTWMLVIWILSELGSLFILLSIFRLFLSVEYLVTFTNCLLKAFVFSFRVIFSLLLNKIVLLGSCLIVLFCSWCKVFQKMCVLVLWSQFCEIFSFHSFSLWSLICLFMSSLMTFMLGSLLLSFLRLFLSWINLRISFGSSFWLSLFFPLGMLCLSEARIAFVRILLETWTFVGLDDLEIVSSISWVNLYWTVVSITVSVLN